MPLTIAVVILLAVTLLYTLSVRAKDIPPPDPVSPTQHLDERKAAIYENLRDLQFEYRVGKLSDADYQTTKQDLQRELAVVLAEVDKLSAALGATAAAKPAPVTTKTSRAATVRERPVFACPSCNATFDKD